MKKNFIKKNNRFFPLKGTRQSITEKIKFESKNIFLKNNQIPLAGKHSILSAMQNKNRKLHYLVTTKENYSIWFEEINKLKLKLEIIVKSREEIDKINNFRPHQNVVLVTEPLKRISIDEFLSDRKYDKKIPMQI